MYWIIELETGRSLAGPFFTYLEAELTLAQTMKRAQAHGDLLGGMPDGVAIAGDKATLN